MEIKKYSNCSVKYCAERILIEILHEGFSQGWSGSIEEKEKIEKCLNKFNVHYVDDMFGRWEYEMKKEQS